MNITQLYRFLLCILLQQIITTMATSNNMNNMNNMNNINTVNTLQQFCDLFSKCKISSVITEKHNCFRNTRIRNKISYESQRHMIKQRDKNIIRKRVCLRNVEQTNHTVKTKCKSTYYDFLSKFFSSPIDGYECIELIIGSVLN